MPRLARFVLPILFALAPLPAQDLGARIDALCAPLIEAQVTPGFVVGVLDGDRELVRCYGRLDFGAEARPTEGTLFEIGSISKVFTSLLLADAVERGLCALDDPVQKHLPDGVTLHAWHDEPIRMWHLATHTSGLPRMPRLDDPDPQNPFAKIDAAAMATAIGQARPQRAPGSRYEYSNLGAGILGYVLVHRNGCGSYDELLRQRITGPLGMQDTMVVLDAQHAAALAPPHDLDGNPAHAWDLAAMAGAGGIRSTVPDMLKFARLQLAPSEPFAAAVKLQQQKRFDAANGPAIALGWHIAKDGVTLWHNGQTGGFHAWLGVMPAARCAVCILTNSGAGQIDRVGEQIVRALNGMEVAPLAIEAPVAVERDALAPLVGKYRLGPGAVLDVTLRERGLYAQLTGQGAFRLYPRSPREFFYRVVEASVTFEVDGDQVKELVLHQNGRDMRAPREGKD